MGSAPKKSRPTKVLKGHSPGERSRYIGDRSRYVEITLVMSRSPPQRSFYYNMQGRKVVLLRSEGQYAEQSKPAEGRRGYARAGQESLLPTVV